MNCQIGGCVCSATHGVTIEEDAGTEYVLMCEGHMHEFRSAGIAIETEELWRMS